MLHNLFFMEQHFLLWLQDSVRNPMLTKIFVFITSLGNGGAFWILLSLGLMIPKKTRKAGFLSLLSLSCCAIVTNVCLKNLVARTRPYDVNTGVQLLVSRLHDYSFPSGHTAAALASVTALYMAGEKKLWKPVLVLACLIGISRLYLYVHYPTDIIGGVIFGSLSGYLGYKIVEWIQKKKIK